MSNDKKQKDAVEAMCFFLLLASIVSTSLCILCYGFWWAKGVMPSTDFPDFLSISIVFIGFALSLIFAHNIVRFCEWRGCGYKL